MQYNQLPPLLDLRQEIRNLLLFEYIEEVQVDWLSFEHAERMMEIIDGDNQCFLTQMSAEAYLSFYVDGSAQRTLYSFLKMALGNTIGNARRQQNPTLGTATRRGTQIVPESFDLSHITHTDAHDISDADLKQIGYLLNVDYLVVERFFEDINNACCGADDEMNFYFWMRFILNIIRHWAGLQMQVPQCFNAEFNAGRDYRMAIDTSEMYQVNEISVIRSVI